MITTRVLPILLLPMLALGACGPSDGGPLEGGGARGGPIRGSVTVFALDERTGAPIEGATVGVDGGAQRTTDASGRAVLTHEGGSVDVAVSAAGYRSETWLGVGAAELTIPLSPSSAPPSGVVRARLEALDTFAPSDPANTVRAVLGATRDVSADPTEPRGELVTCAAGDECAAELAAPAGVVTVFAQIDEVDASGRRVAPLGFAISDPVEVPRDGAIDATALPIVDAVRLRELSVTRPDAPDGVDAVVGVPGLSRAGGVIVLAGDEGDAPFLLPAREGDDIYWVVATASRGTATSQSIARLAPDDSTESIATPPLRALPVATRDAASLRLSEIDGAAMITVTAAAWRTRVFDGRALVTLPDDAPVRVCATDAERAASEWRLAELEHRWTRRACSDP